MELTRDQLIKKYMELQDPTLTATFVGGIDKNGNPFGMRWTPEIAQSIADELTVEEKAFANWQLAFYRKYYPSVNAVYRKKYGVDLPFNPFYSPIGRDIEIETPENMLLAKEAQNYASTVNGSLKSRQGSIKALKFNKSMDILVNHVVRMEHFKAWSGVISDLRRVFGHADMRRAIEQFHGRPIIKTIDNFIEDMARGGIVREKINRVVDAIRINFTKGVLGIKPLIGIKQIPSVLAYTSEMPFQDFVEGVADFWKNPIKNFRFMRDNNGTLKKRWSGSFERDVKDAMKKSWTKTVSGKAKWSDWFFALIRTGDKFATMQGTWAKYKSELKRKPGISTEDALQAGVNSTNRTQPTSAISTLAPGQREGSWAKLGTIFQNQRNKYFRIIANNARNIRFGRGSPVKASVNIVVAWSILPMLFQFITDAFRWKNEKQLQALLLGPLNNLLILGSLSQSLIGWAVGEMYDYQGTPVLSTPQKVKKGISKLRKDDIDTEDIIAAVEFFAEAVGQIGGVPTPYLVQAEKAIRKGRPAELIFTEYSLKKDEDEGTFTDF